MRRRLILATILGWGMSTAAFANGPAETVVEAEQVLSELMAIPLKQIPHQLLKEAQGIAIIPNVIKIGFIGGARRGHGGSRGPAWFALWPAGTDVLEPVRAHRGNGLADQ